MTMTGKDSMSKTMARPGGAYSHLDLRLDVCERGCQKMKSACKPLRSLNFISQATSKRFKQGRDNFRVAF